MNKWLRICLVLMLVMVIGLSLGGKGCLSWLDKDKDDSGSSVPPPVAEILAYLYELVTDTGWWKALSANYQNEGGLQPIAIETASSANYQNETK